MIGDRQMGLALYSGGGLIDMAEFIPDCWITACNTLDSIHAVLLPDGPLG